MKEAKLFTPQEAQQTLPLVKKIVADILEFGQKIRTLSAEVGANAEKNPEIIKIMDQLDELFDEMESLGCYYKDWNFSVGLVDFPAVIDGEEAFLCWRSDEEGLKYYHDVDSGYTGRKPIPAELLLGG